MTKSTLDVLSVSLVQYCKVMTNTYPPGMYTILSDKAWQLVWYVNQFNGTYSSRTKVTYI